MIVKIIRPMLLFMALITLPVQDVTAGEQRLKGYTARVRLSVVAAERLTDMVSTFMSSKLRQLGDVIITDNNPEWHLAVTGIELHTGGTRTGVALSTVIMAPLDGRLTQHIIKALEADGSPSAVIDKMKTKQLAEVKSSWLRAGTDTGIRNLCRRIIEDFDKEYLQLERKKNQRRYGEKN